MSLIVRAEDESAVPPGSGSESTYDQAGETPALPGKAPVLGETPAFPGRLDSRFRGNDGAEVAGTTRAGGTRRPREHRSGESGIHSPDPAEPEPGVRS